MIEQKDNDNNHRILRLLNFLDESPNDCFLLHALALENIKIKEHEEAKNIFERLLSINPNYVGSYYHLGKTFEVLKKTKKAIETYEEGMKMAQIERDFHALNELRGALDLLLDGDDE
jgi:tetratricopeptide (TPR) repeat protein